MSSLLETDNALTSYYEACVVAGPKLCSLYANTTGQIRAHVDKIINDVHIRPVPVYKGTDPSNIVFDVVDYAAVTQEILAALYTPFPYGEVLAEALLLLEAGSGAMIFEPSDEALITSLDTCDFEEPFVAGIFDTVTPIVCGDSEGRALRTFEEARAGMSDLVDTSPFGYVWYNLLFGPCS